MNRNLSRAFGVTLPLAVVLGSISGAPSASASAAVADPEVNSSSATSWRYVANATPAQVNNIAEAGNRIIDLDVTSSAPKFGVAYVANSGAYQRGWWWYYGQTESALNSKLRSHSARLIDVEPYMTKSGMRFAAVMVHNSGAARKTAWWRIENSPAAISKFAKQKGARVTTVSRLESAEKTRFVATFIKNSGVDSKGWWHFYNVDKLRIASELKAHKAQLIDLHQVSAKRFDVVMQKAGQRSWWYYFNVTPGYLAKLGNQLGARPFRVSAAAASGRYNVLYTENSNAETARIRKAVLAKMDDSAFGFYTKTVGGGPVVSLQQSTQFEPASAIKALHLARAQTEIKDTSVDAGTNATWYVQNGVTQRYPSENFYGLAKDVCAYNTDGTPYTTISYVDPWSTLMMQMMQQSDNRATDFFTSRYGFSGLTNFAGSLGLNDTKVRHRTGCNTTWNPPTNDGTMPPEDSNRTTLADLGLLYEEVIDGTVLGTGTDRDAYLGYLSSQDGTGSKLSSLIDAEAAKVHMSDGDKSDFRSNSKVSWKPGGYGLCVAAKDCTKTTRIIRTEAGALWLPKVTDVGLVQVPYVYGHFIDSELPCTFAKVKANTCADWTTKNAAYDTVSVEQFRQVVRAAVSAFQTAKHP